MSHCALRTRPRLVFTAVFGALLLLASSRAFAGGSPTFLGPTPYLSKADSPFVADINAAHVYLEDFECGVLRVPGVTPSDGSVIPPGFAGLIDSVDADDGAIDGSGLNGHSFFTGSGATGITFTFSQAALGAFPTEVGIVWTDGGGTATFEAFDSLGASLGVIGPVAIGDASNAGETAEDRFFGVTFPGGISAIKISNTAGGLEVDHLQYGLYPSTTLAPCGVAPTETPTVIATATPTPTSAPSAGAVVPTLSFPMLALLGLALAGAALVLIRRS
jgi:hypothetical protein